MRAYPVFAAVIAALSMQGAARAAGAKTAEPVLIPLVEALATPVEEIQAEAAGGKPYAQYALSILLAHGLRGAPRDPAVADAMRSAALAARPPMQITQYIAGLNGQPGRVVPMTIPQPGLSRTIATQTDACVGVLVRRAEHDRATGGFPFDRFDENRDAAADQARQADAALCGERFQALSILWSQLLPWTAWPLPACDADDSRCKVLRARVERLNARDPRAEAEAAAARGDFRLGGANFIGPSPQGWSLPGVSCRVWSREMIGKWHINQDVIRDGDSQHTAASLAFIATYNGRMVADPAFPYADICAQRGLKRTARYAGPARTAAEAARSGDLAKLAALDAAVDVNAKDVFDSTALEWATANDDEPMARALLARGADPNSHGPESASPLALALDRERYDLARLMIAKGARMTGLTWLCDLDRLTFRLPGVDPENRHCTWAGLLAAKGQYDLLDDQARAGALNPGPAVGAGPPPTNIDGMGELRAAFAAALKAKDRTAIKRLLPNMGLAPGAAASVITLLYEQDRLDLVRVYVEAQGAEAARSPAEAQLWRQAATARRDGALAFLQDYGADLNLLPPTRLAACGDAARKGDEALLLACVQDAAERRSRIAAALAAGDAPAFNVLVAEAADVRERFKPTLIEAAASAGAAPMLSPLLTRGARLDSGSYFAPPPPRYRGKFRPDPALGAPGAGYLAADARSTPPLSALALRGDAEGLRLLVDAGAGSGLFMALGNLGNLGDPPPGLPSFGLPDKNIDTSNLPDSPGPEKLKAMALIVAEIVRTRGAQALEPSFASAVYSGYDDVLRLMVAQGFDPSKVKAPEMIWQNWAGLGNPCKPSTGRLLVRAGVPVRFPVNAYSRWPPLHTLAAGCFNARSVDALLEAKTIDINAIDDQGRTAVDQAMLYRRTAIAEALRARGGRTAKEIDPDAAARRQGEADAGGDLDLSQYVAE